MEDAGPESVLESLVKIAYFPKLFSDPAALYAALKGAESRGRSIGLLQRLECSFGRKHATLNGEVDALQALRIQKSCRVAQNHPAIAGNGRNRPPAAIGQRLGAVTNHLAAFEQLGDEGVLLKILQHVLRIEAGIGVIQAGYESE